MSTTQVTYHAKGVNFTETGAKKVREFLASQGDADLSLAGLRVGVRGGSRTSTARASTTWTRCRARASR